MTLNIDYTVGPIPSQNKNTYIIATPFATTMRGQKFGDSGNKTITINNFYLEKLVNAAPMGINMYALLYF